MLLIVDKIDNSATLTKANSVMKETFFNVSRNIKGKDISNNSKQNNSFESSKNRKEEVLINKQNDSKISNFQKYIKNVISEINLR